MAKSVCPLRIILQITFCVIISFRLNAQDITKYNGLIEKYSKQYGVDKNIIKSIILVSSAGNPNASSQSGASGLMMLPEEVCEMFKVKNPRNPSENISAGCNYFKSLMNQFNDLELALAAFNAGPAAVKKYGKIPPFAETKKFIADVLSKYEDLENSLVESEVFGFWKGTGKYISYQLTPELTGMKSPVGQTEPFEMEINPDGAGVSIKSFGKLLGNPSNYKTELGTDYLHVEYQGANPWGEQIPNTRTVHTMTFDLDVVVFDRIMKGEFRFKNHTKMIFNSPDLKLPDSEAEVNYIMELNLKK